MPTTTHTKLLSLEPYRHLFPKAIAVDETVKMGASVYDTVDFIPEIINRCTWQVEKFIDAELRGLSTYKVCEKLWYFIKNHITYTPDTRGLEQVRSPRRLIWDGVGDCDCFTTFLGTCFSVLKIPFLNRITKYKENYFQHIYPVVLLGNGKTIIMDCVADYFNYEVPYTTKKDYKMDLQFLDGLEQRSVQRIGVDAQDLFDEFDDEEIGKLNIGNAIKNVVNTVKDTVSTAAQNVSNTVHAAAQNVSQTVSNAVQNPKTIIHAVNQVNPAVVLLRLGFLGSMKLNMGAVASNIKWAYLSKEDAVTRDIDPDKYDQLKKVLTKAEDIFYGAGGSKENLKEAILTGKGNENHEVAGLGCATFYNRRTPLPVLLGRLYECECPKGFNGLGEPVEAAAIAAAASAIGALAALIGSIGNIFKRRKEAKDEAAAEQAAQEAAQAVILPAETQPVQETPATPTDFTLPEGMFDNYPTTNNSGGSNTSTNTPATTNTPAGKASPDGEETFWDKNKKWITPVGIGVGVVGLGFLTYKMVNKNKPAHAINGLPKSRKKKAAKKVKRNAQRQAAIALM